MNIKDVGLLDKDGDGRLSLDEFMQGATTADTSSDTTPTVSRDTTAAPQDFLLESGEFYSNSVSIVFCQAQFKFSYSSVQFELRLSLKPGNYHPHPGK